MASFCGGEKRRGPGERSPPERVERALTFDLSVASALTEGTDGGTIRSTPPEFESLRFSARAGRRNGWVGAVRRLVFSLLLIAFVVFLVVGLVSADFLETWTNGAMICLTCIGVA